MTAFDRAWVLLKEEEVRYHPEDEPMSVEDMESYLNTTELGEIVNAPKSIPTSGDTRKDRMKQTRVMGQTYRGEPTFNLMPLAGENRLRPPLVCPSRLQCLRHERF